MKLFCQDWLRPSDSKDVDLLYS